MYILDTYYVYYYVRLINIGDTNTISNIIIKTFVLLFTIYYPYYYK